MKGTNFQQKVAKMKKWRIENRWQYLDIRITKYGQNFYSK
jgi:hypothetical protein